MVNGAMTEVTKIVNGLSPSADLYNGDPATDVVSMEGYTRCTFVLHQNGASPSSNGNATITVEECTSAAGSGATAIAFKYRKKTTGASATWGSITAATASGFTTTAVEDTIYEIFVTDSALSSDSKFVRLKATESTDAAVIGSVQIFLDGGRYKDPHLIDPLS